MEEDEVLVRHSFECDLGICGGRQNVSHVHTEECTASTSGRERVDNPSDSSSSSNDGTLKRFLSDILGYGLITYTHVCS